MNSETCNEARISPEPVLQLSDAFGPSASEEQVRETVIALCPENWEIRRDPIGNLLIEPEALKQPGLLLDAHMDEVGMMVRTIEENGLMTFLPLGGIDPAAAAGQNVVIETLDGTKLCGVISTRAVHFQKAGADEGFDGLRIDAGCTSLEEAEALGLAPGCFAVFDQQAQFDEKRGLIFGKALDDRIGLAAMLEVLRGLAAEKLPVSAIATVQEEVGERGMQAAIATLQARCAIVFEGAPADDSFAGTSAQTALGKGPMIRAMDRSMITEPALMALARKTAKAFGIPLQIAVRTGGGTNAGILHTHNIPCVVIGIPVRYAHSARGIASMQDYRQAIELGIALGKAMLEDF